MSIYLKIKNIISNPKVRFGYMNKLGVYRHLSDEEFLKKAYRVHLGKELDLENPKTYNEKLQWLKLYDRNPEYTRMVDKYEAKKYVAERIGDEYIIPTLGVWDKFEDIDFDELPEKFVLKCTHDSGGLVICKDKKNLDIGHARKKINDCLKLNYFNKWREWPYKDVKPRIIAEQYMEDYETKELRDYKFFVFEGEVKTMFIATERSSKTEETKFDFFDMNYNHLDIRNGHPNAAEIPKKPKKFEEMKALAEKLAGNLHHLRVDFYEVNGRVYFGELTFSHWGGLVPFEPEEWDLTFGNWIKLCK